jgi:hypothetical protein
LKIRCPNDGGWPAIVEDPRHAYGYSPPKPMRVMPNAAAITRIEECFDWLMLLGPKDARIVWLRADGMRWRQVCIRAGVVRSTASWRWAAALLSFAKKLDYQTKTMRKAKALNRPMATISAIPRESVVNTQDDAQNALNFGRDTSSGSGA